MSHYMTALAMKQRGLKPAAKIVLYWLADHHNGETGLCCPSITTLEDECEMGRSAIIRNLEALESLGLIGRETRLRENGSKTSNSYFLYFEVVSKRHYPSPETTLPLVSNQDDHNLGTKNLGNEPSEDSCEIDQAVEFYNSKAEGNAWPKMQRLTPARKTALQARLKEVDGLDGWIVAMDKAAASDFLSGRSGGWIANFDWLCKQANFTKLLEGNYDNRDHNGYGTRDTGRRSPHEKLLAGFASVANRDGGASEPDF